MTLSVVDITPTIAAEVRATKAELLSGAHADLLRDLLERRGVLVFPQIGFTDSEQIEFTQTLGTFAPERTGEQVYSVTLDTSINELADYLKGSLYWHIDGTMNAVRSAPRCCRARSSARTVPATPNSPIPTRPTTRWTMLTSMHSNRCG